MSKTVGIRGEGFPPPFLPAVHVGITVVYGVTTFAIPRVKKEQRVNCHERVNCRGKAESELS